MSLNAGDCGDLKKNNLKKWLMAITYIFFVLDAKEYSLKYFPSLVHLHCEKIPQQINERGYDTITENALHDENMRVFRKEIKKIEGVSQSETDSLFSLILHIPYCIEVKTKALEYLAGTKVLHTSNTCAVHESPLECFVDSIDKYPYPQQSEEQRLRNINRYSIIIKLLCKDYTIGTADAVCMHTLKRCLQKKRHLDEVAFILLKNVPSSDRTILFLSYISNKSKLIPVVHFLAQQGNFSLLKEFLRYGLNPDIRTI